MVTCHLCLTNLVMVHQRNGVIGGRAFYYCDKCDLLHEYAFDGSDFCFMSTICRIDLVDLQKEPIYSKVTMEDWTTAWENADLITERFWTTRW